MANINEFTQCKSRRQTKGTQITVTVLDSHLINFSRLSVRLTTVSVDVSSQRRNNRRVKVGLRNLTSLHLWKASGGKGCRCVIFVVKMEKEDIPQVMTRSI